MANSSLESLILNVNFVGTHAGAVFALLKDNGCHPQESAGKSSAPKQKTALTGALALYLNQQPKDISKGFVFGSDPRSCDVLLANTKDTGISANHFSIQIDWGSRNPIITCLSSNNLQAKLFGMGGIRILPKNAWQILNSGTTKRVQVHKGLRVLLTNPVRGDSQAAYNHNLENYLRDFKNAVPELANISLNDTDVTPFILYRCPGLKGREYYATLKIKTGDFDYDTKVIRYNAKCRQSPDALVTTQEVARISTEQQYGDMADQVLEKSMGGQPGGIYVVKHFRKRDPLSALPHQLPELQRLSHLNLEELVDIITGTSLFMIVVDIFSHHTLQALHQESPLNTEEAGFVLGQTFTALEYLHDKGWTHGNLDPRSIHIMSRQCLWVKLADAALAEYVDLGKPDGYHDIHASQAPKTPNKCPADIWSAGVVALQLLLHPAAGRLPDRHQERLQSDWTAKLGKLAKDMDRTSRNDATACVRTVLRYDYKKRPTATDVLKEPWIVQTRGELSIDNPHYSFYTPARSRERTPEPSSSAFDGQAT